MANVQPYIPEHSSEGQSLGGSGFAGNSGEILGNQALGAANQLSADVANSNRQVWNNIANVGNTITNGLVNAMATAQAANRTSQALTNKSTADAAVNESQRQINQHNTKYLADNQDWSDDARKQYQDINQGVWDNDAEIVQKKLTGYGAQNAFTTYRDVGNASVTSAMKQWDESAVAYRKTQGVNNWNDLKTNSETGVASGDVRDLVNTTNILRSPQAASVAVIAGKDREIVPTLNAVTKQSIDATFTNLANTSNYGAVPLEAVPKQRQALQGQIAMLQDWQNPGNPAQGIPPSPYHFATPETINASIKHLQELDTNLIAVQTKANLIDIPHIETQGHVDVYGTIEQTQGTDNFVPAVTQVKFKYQRLADTAAANGDLPHMKAYQTLADESGTELTKYSTGVAQLAAVNLANLTKDQQEQAAVREQNAQAIMEEAKNNFHNNPEVIQAHDAWMGASAALRSFSIVPERDVEVTTSKNGQVTLSSRVAKNDTSTQQVNAVMNAVRAFQICRARNGFDEPGTGRKNENKAAQYLAQVLNKLRNGAPGPLDASRIERGLSLMNSGAPPSFSNLLFDYYGISKSKTDRDFKNRVIALWEDVIHTPGCEHTQLTQHVVEGLRLQARKEMQEDLLKLEAAQKAVMNAKEEKINQKYPVGKNHVLELPYAPNSTYEVEPPAKLNVKSKNTKGMVPPPPPTQPSFVPRLLPLREETKASSTAKPQEIKMAEAPKGSRPLMMGELPGQLDTSLGE